MTRKSVKNDKSNAQSNEFKSTNIGKSIIVSKNVPSNSFSFINWFDSLSITKSISSIPAPIDYISQFLPSLTSERLILLVITFIKILLYPTLYSTDYHVHRNWLSVTNSLPMNEWYSNSINEWTLDYPPLFGYAQYILSLIAYYFDENMLKITSKHYDSEMTKLFMKSSVIVCDLMLYFSLIHWNKTTKQDDDQIALITTSNTEVSNLSSKSEFESTRLESVRSTSSKCRLLIFSLLLCHPTLLMLDHMHFQYNGILLSLLILTCSYLKKESYCYAAIIFSILIHTKHIFLYLSPPIGIYLFRKYCFKNIIISNKYQSNHSNQYSLFNSFFKCFNSITNRFDDFHSNSARRNSYPTPTQSIKLVFLPLRFITLGLIVISVSIVTFGPFIHNLPDLFGRLFPWRRGLSHAYWASNIWSLYNSIDLFATFIAKRFQLIDLSSIQSLTGGLVDDIKHNILPTITSRTTLILTSLSMIPSLYKLWNCPVYSVFNSTLIYCALSSFMLGWHVHEKALTLALIPTVLISLQSMRHTRLFLLLSAISSFVLLPLFTDPMSHSIKVMIPLTYHIAAYIALTNIQEKLHKQRRIKFDSIFRLIDSLYAIGIVVVYLLYAQILPIVLPNFSFLPLLLVSCYSAIGCLIAWFRCWRIIQQESILHQDDEFNIQSIHNE